MMREQFEKAIHAMALQHNYQHMALLLKRVDHGYATTWVDNAWTGWNLALKEVNNAENR